MWISTFLVYAQQAKDFYPGSSQPYCSFQAFMMLYAPTTSYMWIYTFCFVLKKVIVEN